MNWLALAPYELVKPVRCKLRLLDGKWLKWDDFTLLDARAVNPPRKMLGAKKLREVVKSNTGCFGHNSYLRWVTAGHLYRGGRP